MVGYQLETAYRERKALGETDEATAGLAIRAGEALFAASRRAASRKDWRRAIDLLTRSAELLRPDPSRRAAVLPDLIRAYLWLPDLVEADNAYHEALDAARLAGSESSRIRAELARADLYLLQDRPGWHARAKEAADRSIEFFSDPEDPLTLGQAYLLKSFADEEEGIGTMIDELKIAHSYAERTGDDLLLVQTWDELGGAMLSGRTPFPEVLEFVRQEHEWASLRGIPFAEADAMLGEAYALVASGETDEARAHLARVKALFTSLPGTVSQHGESYNLAGRLERDAGDFSAAEREYRDATKLFDTPTTVRWWRTAAVNLAETLLDQGRVDDAGRLLAEVQSRGQASQAPQLATEEVANARLAAARGETTKGLEMATKAVASIAGTGLITREAGLREQLAEMLLAAGQVDGARIEFGKSAELLAEKVYPVAERRVRAKLAALA
jgi:tetratricopeptide (TPR) repeat protein